MQQIAIFLILTLFTCPICGAEIKFDVATPGKLKILLDGQPVADYVFQDPEIPRPYFAKLHAPSGIQVSRNQPPDPKLDVADHPLFHPGLWLTFGVLSGNDYWRNAAKTEFIEFTEAPEVTANGGRFTARFRYLDQNDPAKTVCEELFSCRIVPLPAGTLIVWDSIFSGDNEFEFGDQEEMGLGIRMATPLRSEPQARSDIPPGTGTILDAEGRKNGAEIWGKSAPWCDYSGTIDGNQVGATIFCHPDNFRPSWFHARDYGLLVANAFGQKAFHQGDESRVVVKPGEKFRLRYGILLHGDSEVGLNEAYQDYVNLTDDAK
jgi:hypothetical protein